MTHTEVLQVIKRHADSKGGIRALARHWKVSAAYLSDILLEKRYPGPKVLKHLGLKGSIRTVRTFTARANGKEGQQS
jgi:hypothetical protein